MTVLQIKLFHLHNLSDIELVENGKLSTLKFCLLSKTSGIVKDEMI